MSKPWLDLSELLTDPDFADTTLVCTRNVQTVSLNGIAVNTPTTTNFTGIAYQTKGSVLRREDGGARIEGELEIITSFVLIDGRTGTDADIVTWNGRQYTVAVVEDWTSFGAGFVKATCSLLSLSGG